MNKLDFFLFSSLNLLDSFKSYMRNRNTGKYIYFVEIVTVITHVKFLLILQYVSRDGVLWAWLGKFVGQYATAFFGSWGEIRYLFWTKWLAAFKYIWLCCSEAEEHWGLTTHGTCCQLLSNIHEVVLNGWVSSHYNSGWVYHSSEKIYWSHKIILLMKI